MFSLLENVSQLEDLSIDEYLHTIENLATLEVKKAIKGFDFFFGLDGEGKLFTSKYSDKDPFYSSHRYASEPDNNAFIGAHKYVFKHKHKLEQILSPNQVVHAKIQFFEQKWDKENKLILIDEFPDNDIFSRKLIRSNQTFSIDGLNTSTIETPSYWDIGFQKDLKEPLDTSSIRKELDKLREYLNSVSYVDDKYTNFDITKLNLGSIPMDQRNIYKVARNKINDVILTKFKLPIKSEFLDTNPEIDIETDDDIVQIKDDSLLKNNFFLGPKHELAGIVRTNDPSAKLELRGGLYGEVQQRIGTLFGIPELANMQSAKKIFKDIKGNTPEETAQNFANSLSDKSNFFNTKTKLIAIYKNLIKDIHEKLDQFKHDNGEYELKLSDNTILKYSQDDIQTNLNAFGEILDIVSQQLHDIKTSTNIIELVLVVYQRVLELVHNDIIVKEDLNIKQFKHLSTEDICFAFMANYLAALLLLRNKDKTASSLVKDNSDRYKKYNKNMSRVNTWAFLIFNCNYNKVANEMLNIGTWKELKKIAGRFIERRIHYVHDSLSKGNNLLQDWALQEDTVKLLLMRLEVYEKGLSDCIQVIRYWDDANQSDRVQTVNQLFFYLQRHDSQSPLFARMRKLANDVLINTKSEKLQNGVNPVIKESLIKILEDEAATASPVTPSGNIAGVTSSQAVAPVPKKLFRGKVIIRRPRTFVKKSKFERPNKEDQPKQFGAFSKINEMKSVQIEWNDLDVKQENYKGFEFTRQQYNLVSKVVLEANDKGWPEVKLSGSKLDIERFLKEQYGLEYSDIQTLIGD
jgi:hypothetical protein